MQKRKISFSILTLCIFIFAAILFSASVYYRFYYVDVDPEQLFYTLMETKSASPDVVWVVVGFIGIPTLIISVIITYLFLSSRNGFEYKKTYNKKIRIIALVLSFVLLFTNIYATLKVAKIDEFIRYQSNEGTFIEENYVDPKTTNISFPDEKRNLILIFAESMESSYTSFENGGCWNTDLIPELYNLANENINFSHNEKLGGAKRTYGMTWTTAGMTATLFGLPLKIKGNQYGVGTEFLPGAYSMFEILQDNGYEILSISGSDGEFGGKAQMLKDHGNIKDFDYFDAIDEGKIPSNYFKFWGYEDTKLFEYSKEKITNMANGDKPFMVTVETIDTHYPDGYRCEECESIYGYQYLDVVRCASKQISSFIDWVQQQTWYENTTIVVIGDHLTMKSNMFGDDQSNNRTTFNLFVNSVTQGENIKNRQFMTADMFPTILASIGCEIEGEKLGLGTNLFSKSQTLYEEFGYDYVNEEFKKKSIFYTNEIM